MLRSFISLMVMLAIQSLTALAMVAVPVLAPTAAPDIGVPVTFTGLFIGVVFLGAMWATLLSGSLVRRFGAIRVSQAALLACAAGLLVLLIGSPWLLMVSAALIGFGYGPITPASSHILMRTTPAHLMSLMFSIKQTGVPLGAMLAGLVLPPATLAFGWRGGALGVAISCIAVALLAESTRRQLDTDNEPGLALSLQSVGAPIKLVWSVPSLRLLVISSFFFSATQVSLTTFLLPYLTGHMTLSLISAGVIFSAAQGAGVAGRILWGHLADRRVAPPIMLGGLALAGAGASIVAAIIEPSSGLVALMCLFMLYGAVAIGWNGVFLAAVAREAPSGCAGMATGGSLAITFFGAVIGAPAFGLLTQWSGSYGMGFIAFSGISALCGVALIRKRNLFLR
jgi:MFS family permease